MNKKLYDILANISRYILPALGGLYFTLADVWGLPYGSQIMATCTALIIALNVLLGIDSAKYQATIKSSA